MCLPSFVESVLEAINPNHHPNGSSLAINLRGDKLFVGQQGRVMQIDTNSGSTDWKTGLTRTGCAVLYYLIGILNLRRCKNTKRTRVSQHLQNDLISQRGVLIYRCLSRLYFLFIRRYDMVDLLYAHSKDYPGLGKEETICAKIITLNPQSLVMISS